MTILISYLVFLVLSINTFVFLSAFLQEKVYSEKPQIFFCLLVVSIFLTLFDEIRTILGFGYQFMFLNILSTLGMVIPILLLFRANLKTKVAILSLRILFISIAEGMSVLTIGPLIGYENFLSFIISRMAGFSSLGFDFVLCLLIKFIRRKGIYLTSRILFLEIVLSILTCIGWNISQNIIIKNNDFASKSHYLIEIIFGLLLILFYIGFEFANSIQETRLEVLSNRQRNQLKERHYKNVEEQQRYILALKHDMKNQLLIIKGNLSNQEDILKIKKIIKAVIEEIPSKN
ncbi:hypothetical protein ACWY2R_07740 [Enterococcus avium]